MTAVNKVVLSALQDAAVAPDCHLYQTAKLTNNAPRVYNIQADTSKVHQKHALSANNMTLQVLHITLWIV